MRAKQRRHDPIPYTDPLHAGRHPFQTFMLSLCVVSGVPILFGRISASSIESQLPFALAYAWGLSLFVGSITALTGSYWRGKYENALTLERVGLLIAGAAAVAYAIVVAFSVPPLGGLTAGAIVMGFGVSCMVRARDIGRIIRRAAEDHSTVVAREGETDLHATMRGDEDDA